LTTTTLTNLPPALLGALASGGVSALNAPGTAQSWALVLAVVVVALNALVSLVQLLWRRSSERGDGALAASFHSIDRSLAGINASVNKLEARIESVIEQAHSRELTIEQRLSTLEAQAAGGDD
jgi:uncharacterized protein YlxW (UPF0749 family)